MGQRLIINIIDDDLNILANGYYHWDAYTRVGASRLEEINNFIKCSSKNDYNSKKDYAVAMLEATGATLYEEYNGRKVDEEKLNRNNGLISVSEEKINNSLSLAEAIIDVDIDNECVFFDIYFAMNEDDFEEDYSTNSINLVEGEFMTSSFEDLNVFIENIKNLDCNSYFIYDGQCWFPIFG